MSLLLLLALTCLVHAQSGLYVPSAKPVKNMQRALTNPETFYLLIQYRGNDSTFSVADLDLLDSAFRIAFSYTNPNYYTMTIEGYGGNDEGLTRRRVDGVYRYFAQRTYSPFPIRKAYNPIHCSCVGDTVELLRFEVPTTLAVYNTAELPEARRVLNKSVPLDGSVLVTFHNDPDECVGEARGCFLPRADTLIHGYYASVLVSKGAVYSIENSKDTCPDDFMIRIDDHMNYKIIVDQYNLIPHPKQLLVQAGYITFKTRFPVDHDTCAEAAKDSIFIRIPATQEQVDAKLKFFAKVRNSRGVEYKALPTRKLPGKGPLVLQAAVNIGQLDTIYLGKRIQEKELSKYFYEVDTPTEAAAFTVGRRHYVAYSVGKQGEYQLKKPLQALFRIIPDQEEESVGKAESGRQKIQSPEEIIED